MFFDRDGVLNKDTSYIDSTKRIEILHNNLEKILDIIEEKGIEDSIKVIVSNQSGIAREYFTIDVADKIMKKVILDIKGYFDIDAYLFAPYHISGRHLFESPDDANYFRKPNPGMINFILSKYGVDKNNSILFGDRETDKLAALNAGLSNDNIFII
ncbi:HAD-IIIA family hydrolase [Prochlorococcus marinus]|uniref:HAD-IIIA family hydrolase n=1 Tax=Prochlorococcus marinus TaxID=1219 RepID=UPI0023A967F1|nr:HAD-IIIA family hydrolase [Prochlorococcus marinus]